ncbi:putative peroxisome biogenesis factor 6 [Erysiphe necator]|uniref:Peroxisomal ATPase PEX1 n=1 Tax=Uncinula necator TaxID=52586 RepID=A0A0B1P3Z6_UNCNE|nr:putative peroxisome biogenesis factor 6 [Erysiphe necator]
MTKKYVQNIPIYEQYTLPVIRTVLILLIAMPTGLKKRNGQSLSAEISLVHLNNCLVNLPATLCSLLTNVNNLAQNVIVELTYRVHVPGSNSTNELSNSKSIYVGWTGFQSRRKLVPIVDKNGISGIRSSFFAEGGGDQEIALIELDYNFARTLEISDGLKVTASLHLDPPIAHAINIEPMTVEDWEMIELYTKFLELNLISQIRALPNPNFIPPNGLKYSPNHPLTLKLSPSSTANIIVTSLSPEPPSSSPFAKLDPNAEIIVAPKTRSKHTRPYGENRSSTSRRSASGRRKSGREENRKVLYFRGIDKTFCEDWFVEKINPDSQCLKVWVDRDVIISNGLKDIAWVLVSVLKPASLQPHIDPQKEQQEIENLGAASPIASKVVAQLQVWENPPDSQHIVLSKSLCACLACEGIVGGIVRLEPAPPQVLKTVPQILKEDESQASKSGSRVIKIYPFSSRITKAAEGLKFGGESKAELEEAARRIVKIFSGKTGNKSLFDGPLTDGMILGKKINSSLWPGWEGGILRFDQSLMLSSKQACHWFIGSELKFSIDVQPPVSCPSSVFTINGIAEQLPSEIPNLVGIDDLLDQIQNNLYHLSSVLLTGAQGSGKSSVAKVLAHRLRESAFFHVTYFPCQKVIKNESRISTIKENFQQIFLSAAWGARLGGHSLVILDDIDKLCPTETELETSENGRSRQISEGLCIIIRKYCRLDTGVTLLAITETKESLHNVIISGHVFQETFALKTPNKDGRKKVLEMITQQTFSERSCQPNHGPLGDLESRPVTAASSTNESIGSWMESGGENHEKEISGVKGNAKVYVSPDLDFLDLASDTDGYMPGDLVLLVTRARGEAIIRAVSETYKGGAQDIIEITRKDFTRAIEGFTPASLRGVTLQKSTATFDSIGGLHTTRQILLETLQYPTTYAPIFAQCPLRLRSGILLYGYPGCGKTLLASIVAGEFGLNFISVKGPEILNKYIGASEKSVRDLFERAQTAKPCVLFFDEFDSIAPKRGHDSTGVTDRVVNQILTQMDGAEGLTGVYVLAATSRPDLIDPALLRPGRLDKSIICDLPNEEDRIDILHALGRKLKLEHDARNNLPKIAAHTEGYSGADLQALMYNAHLEAIHDLIYEQNEVNSGKGMNKPNGKVSSKEIQDFLQFRYGEEEDRIEAEQRARVGINKSKDLAERATITRKLAEIRLEKCNLKTKIMTKSAENDQNEQKQVEQEAVIEWRHLAKSLSTTKASISADERNRLAAIYREFLTARDGKVRSGDGGREVGGRVSLM